MERPVSAGAERALFVTSPTQALDLTSIATTSASSKAAGQAGAPAEKALEPLEQRRLLSSAWLSNGVLTIVGNDRSDNNLGVWESGSKLVAVHNGQRQSFAGSSVKKIAIHGGKEDDKIWITDDVKRPSILKGYKGDDTLSGGSGQDWIYGGDEEDRLFGNGGDDFLFGDDGNDSLWGGQGNDYQWGGAGSDQTNGAGHGPSTGSGNDSNAASPKAVIRAQRKQIMAGHAIHVHATDSSLGTGSPQNALYEWDFGDRGSNYNYLQGFNAAHIYNRPGTYTIKLTVTNQAGKRSTTSSTVRVTSNTRDRIYVSESGSDSNPGTQSRPIRSFGRAAQMVNRRSDIEVLFRRGDSFNAETCMDLRGDNVLIGAYGSGSSPVIRWTADVGGYPTMISPKGDDVTIQHLTFTSSTSNPPQAIRTSGNNVTVRGNTFLTLGYAVNANMRPNGLLVQGNAAPKVDGIESYFVWGEGSDHVYLGNKVANVYSEHVIRVVGVDRMLAWQNNLTNTTGQVRGDSTPKGAMTLHKGSYFWAGRNEFNDGPYRVGPLGEGDGLHDKGARLRYVVLDGNTFNTHLVLDHGLERVMVRNNILNSDDSAIKVSGYNSTYRRSINDVTIANNTVINKRDTGRFVSVDKGATGITLVNNLYAAPNLTAGPGATASVYVSDSNLDAFRYIGNNVWAKADSIKWAENGQNYVWPTWSNQKGYRDIGEWNAFSVVGTDHFSNVSMNGYTPSGSSTAAKAGRWFEGVFQDRYGKDRPSSGTWTAGAVQR